MLHMPFFQTELFRIRNLEDQILRGKLLQIKKMKKTIIIVSG